MGVESLEIVRRYFENVEVRFFHLFVLGAVPFRKTFLFWPLRWGLERMDQLVLSNSIVGKYAWIMIFTAAGPKKSDAMLKR